MNQVFFEANKIHETYVQQFINKNINPEISNAMSPKYRDRQGRPPE
jgi:hypothetical protein